MTTKTISNTITTGYTLSASYTGITVTPSGLIGALAGGYPGAAGGIALTMPNGGQLVNRGAILAGAGAQGSGAGGAGGAAVLSSAAISALNSGLILGGDGGSGGASGGTGGAGGNGVTSTSAITIANYGTIEGGAAGSGGSGSAGGMGGAGVAGSDTSSVVNSGVIFGGQGGGGGSLGSGGIGGDGVSISGSGTVNNYGYISGGEGGFGTPNVVGGHGVVLTGGGVVTNFSTITVGFLADVAVVLGGSGSVGNYGTILGEVTLSSDGSVTNGSKSNSSALILGEATAGVQIDGPGTVTNFGQIRPGGTSPNAHAGVVLGNGGAIVNYGTIGGTLGRITNAWGVVLNAGGSVTNGSASDHSALIVGVGYTGLYVSGAGTVTNFGTISGTSGQSVSFNSVDDILIAEPGSAFIGKIAGGGGTLDLAGGTSGTISGLGGSGSLSGAVTGKFAGFGHYFIDAGGTWTLNGNNTLAAGDTFIVKGTLANTGTLVGAGAVGGTGAVTNAGTIDATGTAALTLRPGALTNAGLLEATNPGALVSPGGLTLYFTTIFNAGGVIEANGANTHVRLQNAAIHGGALITAAGGLFDTIGTGNVLDGTASPLSNQGVFRVDAATAVRLAGMIANTGTIKLAGGNLTIGAVGATIAGGGSVQITPGSRLYGSVAGATLTNYDNVYGGGSIGNGYLTLINTAGGFIRSTGPGALTLNTGPNTIVNAGILEGGNGTGGMTIKSAVNNTGRLIAYDGILIVTGRVTGAGVAQIHAGTLAFDSAFAENVTFTGPTPSGTLVLARSQIYTGTISGFSTTGATSLDLSDIAFGGSTMASYAGTTTSGVLTVTDGAHTAHIKLAGNYTGSTFTIATDGHGGTIVVDPTKAAAFIGAMAAFGAAGVGGMTGAVTRRGLDQPMLTVARHGAIA